MKGVIHKVYCELYKTDLTVCFHRETWMEKYNNGTIDSCAGMTYFRGRDSTIHIFIEKNEHGGISVSTTSHEAYHVADFIFDKCGIEYKRDSGNEHMAYLLGWIVHKIFDCLELDNKLEESWQKRNQQKEKLSELPSTERKEA